MSAGHQDPAAVSVRSLRSHEEYLACVELQRETWGRSFTDLVPPSILKVTQRIGGVAAGAFDTNGRLLGFVFGMTGVRDGEIVHWSDMLAVREEARDHGLGRRLKQFQRDECARMGVKAIYWTYDPLVARNAHLNFNRLGVRVVEYVEDMYGSETDSTLHRGVGTDRFIVAWPVAPSPEVVERDGTPVGVPPEQLQATCVNLAAGGAHQMPDRLASDPPQTLRIEIPYDIAQVQSSSLSMAAHWRSATRRAFVWCLAHGYEVTTFYRDVRADRGYYVLTRQPRRAR